MKRSLLTTSLCVLVTLHAGAQLVINEMMQSNIDCIMDDLNEFPDSWVELYNTGSEPVNLKDYQIGTSAKADKAYQLPQRTIAPKGYVVIFCDKEETDLHTSFRLESGKDGEVYLLKGGEIIDQVVGMKKQPAPNVAYGRKTDGDEKWGYQLTPTPGSANRGETCGNKDILGQPVFSEPGRVVSGTINLQLALSLPEGSPEGTEIRYTTDGSEPTANSALYKSPIHISKSTVILAKLFCKGYLSPRATAQSYISHGRDITLPVISISINDKYLNDPKIGIYVDGTYKNGTKNYEFDWRRPMNFEYFEGENSASILNQLCETRIMGGATRSSKFKSLAIYANKRFGTKRLEYEFFPDQKPGLNDFKSISLRNAGNDFDYLYMRDAIIQRTMAQYVDLDWQAWRPAIIYVNGKYQGMLNIRERSNEDNIYTNYDGLEDVDMIENWNELKEGSIDSWRQFQEFYGEHGHTLKEYEQWIDWEEFFNLMIMNLYYNNQDFPGNNIVMWRPQADGGRWRFVAKDTDFGLGLYGSNANYNTIEWLHNPNYDSGRSWANHYEHTRLFRRMMEDADLHREFLDRCAIYMGDFMNERGTREVWDPMYEMIKYEYPHHRKLINEWWPNYQEEVESARNWLAKRTDEFYKQLGNYYKLANPVPMTINTNQEQVEGSYTFNGIKLSKGCFDGKFYAHRSVTLQGEAPEGKEVTGWDIIQVATNGVVKNDHVPGNSYSFTMPACQKLIIQAVVEVQSGISQVQNRHWKWQGNGQSLFLSDVPSGTVVTLYTLQGIPLSQVRSDGSTLQLPLPYRHQVYILKVGDRSVKVESE